LVLGPSEEENLRNLLRSFIREAIISDSWLVFTQSSIVGWLVVVRVGVILTVLLSSQLAYWMHLGTSHSTSVSRATEDPGKGS
jgi:TctA family transporter